MKQLLITLLLLVSINPKAKDITVYADYGKSFDQLSYGTKVDYNHFLIGYSFGGDVSVTADRFDLGGDSFRYDKTGVTSYTNRSYKIGYDLLEGLDSRLYTSLTVDTQKSFTRLISGETSTTNDSRVGVEISYSGNIDAKLPIKWIGSLSTTGNVSIGLGFSF